MRDEMGGWVHGVGSVAEPAQIMMEWCACAYVNAHVGGAGFA